MSPFFCSIKPKYRKVSLWATEPNIFSNNHVAKHKKLERCHHPKWQKGNMITIRHGKSMAGTFLVPEITNRGFNHMDCLLLMDQVLLGIRRVMQKLPRMEVGYLMLNLATMLNGWSKMNQVYTLPSPPCLEVPEISSGFGSGRCICILLSCQLL